MTRNGRVKLTTITGCRALVSNLAADDDVQRLWLPGAPKPNACLEVTIRHPKLMNDANVMAGLVKGKQGNLMFPPSHQRSQAFTKATSTQRRADGWCHESFQISRPVSSE
jgi:hypothetical protein